MPGLLRGVARTAVVAGTASAVGGRVHHRQQQRWAQEAGQPQQQYDSYAQPYPPPPPAPVAAAPAAAPDPIEQLKELAALKQQGILTEEEFAAEKAKVLGG